MHRGARDAVLVAPAHSHFLQVLAREARMVAKVAEKITIPVAAAA